MAAWTSPRVPAAGNSSKQVAELEAQVAELTRKLDEAVRAGKRQAAPFRKGPPKPDPKTPGRKSGDAHGKHGHRPPPPPEQVAECHEAHLPDACPHCRGRLVETGTADQFQTEIPRTPLIRKFRVHVGHCEACGKRTQGRHPLQTSDALGAAASQVGPDAQAAAALLHTQMGLSHGKVASVFRALFGITLTRGAILNEVAKTDAPEFPTVPLAEGLQISNCRSGIDCPCVERDEPGGRTAVAGNNEHFPALD